MHGASEDDVPVPPLMKTALTWGLFMGVSSNLRYQVKPLCVLRVAIRLCATLSQLLTADQWALGNGTHPPPCAADGPTAHSQC